MKDNFTGAFIFRNDILKETTPEEILGPTIKYSFNPDKIEEGNEGDQTPLKIGVYHSLRLFIHCGIGIFASCTSRVQYLASVCLVARKILQSGTFIPDAASINDSAAKEWVSLKFIYISLHHLLANEP